MLAFWVGFFSADGKIVQSCLVSKEKKSDMLGAYEYACSGHRKEFTEAVVVDLYSFILCHIPANIDDAKDLVSDCKVERFLWI
jgi:hypothetical protein